MDGLIPVLEQKVQEQIAGQPDIFLVELRIKPTNNIKVFLDGDNGIAIEQLIRYNRSLYKVLEESALFPGGDFSLEVSSPGVDEPLKLHRQYVKNKGRFAEVTLADGSKKEGRLLDATGENIVLEEEKGKGKKKEVIMHTIPFSDIRTTRIQVKF
ncbi:MAG TPA: ribosome maturation factor [Chitinophagaceae bacterium]|nr:ribosome maturation factor [Chitinophagaceae bacterium]